MKNKPILVKEDTKIKFIVAKTILDYSNDDLLNKLLKENPETKKLIDFDKPFKQNVIKE